MTKFYYRTFRRVKASFTIFFKRKSKISLQSNEGALITSELGGVAQGDFDTWCVSKLWC